jgi:hypothetical protein
MQAHTLSKSVSATLHAARSCSSIHARNGRSARTASAAGGLAAAPVVDAAAPVDAVVLVVVVVVGSGTEGTCGAAATSVPCISSYTAARRACSSAGTPSSSASGALAHAGGTGPQRSVTCATGISATHTYTHTGIRTYRHRYTVSQTPVRSSHWVCLLHVYICVCARAFVCVRVCVCASVWVCVCAYARISMLASCARE